MDLHLRENDDGELIRFATPSFREEDEGEFCLSQKPSTDYVPSRVMYLMGRWKMEVVDVSDCLQPEPPLA